jgi:DNA-binding CsgD family transcriptional regulator
VDTNSLKEEKDRRVMSIRGKQRKRRQTMKLLWGKLAKDSSAKEGYNFRTILTNDCVLRIKKMLMEGELTVNEIASIFEITPSTIHGIKNGQKWKYFTTEEEVKQMQELSKVDPNGRGAARARAQALDSGSVANQIKDMLIEGNKTVREIATALNVSRNMIYDVKNGNHCWADFSSEEEFKKMSDNDITRKGEVKRETIMGIKDLLIEGVLTQKEIAQKMNFDGATISQIKTGKVWAYMFTEEELIGMNKKKKRYNFFTKLTSDALNEIKLLLLEGKLNNKEISEMYNIGEMTVSKIKHGKKVRTFDEVI